MRNRKSLGQTMTEYIIIIALCAIGLLLVLTFFGNDIKQIFFASTQSLRKGQAVDVKYDTKAVSGGTQAVSGKQHGVGTGKLDAE